MSELKIEFKNNLDSVFKSQNNLMPKADNIAQPKTTFADLFSEKMAESNNLIKESDLSTEELVSGKNKDLHGTMIALEKADISFRMLMQVRNKMIEAYKEIMRMQV